jgi:hypothetical protein
MFRFNRLAMTWMLVLGLPVMASAEPRLLTLKQLEAQFEDESIHPTAKALKVQLLKSCNGCHIQTKEYEATFLAQFGDFSKAGVANRYAGVGTVNSSVLYNQVEINRMPTQGHLPLQQKTALLQSIRAWIEAGSPLLENVPTKAAKDENFLVRVIAQDLPTVKDKANTRYISLVHLFNNPETQVRIPKIREAVFKLVNSLSWKKELVRPTVLDKEGLVLRIDMKNYEWSADQWKSIERTYPYILDHWQLGGTSRQLMTQLVQATGTATPIVRGDWMVSQMSIPPLYNVFMSLPESSQALEKILNISVENNVATGNNVIRWAFASSGVSQHNRMIERHQVGGDGYYWKSYDFDGDEGEKDIRKNPLGLGVQKAPPAKDSFKHAGGEIIFSLPNGLQGYMLVAASGKRIDVAPVEIVSDIEQPDRNVINGLSCMRCHDRGLIRKEDQVAAAQNLSQFNSDTRTTVEALYRSRNPELKGVFENDIQRFQVSLAALGIYGAEPIREAVAVYNSPVSRNLFLSEMGLTDETAKDVLARLGSMKTQSPLRTRFEPLQRRAALGLKRPTVEASIKQIQQSLIEEYIQMSLPSVILEKLKPQPPVKPPVTKPALTEEDEDSREYTRSRASSTERRSYSTTTIINGVVQESSSGNVSITIYR